MIREDLKIPLTMLSRHYLDAIEFKGSYKGKRFIFQKAMDKDENGKGISGSEKLKVYLWKDVLNFENTPKDQIKIETFDYTDEGIQKGLDYVESTEV